MFSIFENLLFFLYIQNSKIMYIAVKYDTFHFFVAFNMK